MNMFSEARSVLLFSQPFFGTLLMKMRHVPDDTLQPPTACVNRTELRYVPAFFNSLTLDEAVFVIAHEIMHQAWMHLPRMEAFFKSGVGPDGKPYNHRRMNQAADYPINALLVEMGVGKPMPKEKFPMCLDPARFPSTMTPEEVYCLLSEEDEQGGDGDGGGDPLDGHDFAGGSDDEADAITPSDVIQAAQIHKLARGALPAGLERLLGTLQKPTHSPWKVLRQFVTKSVAGYDRTSWRRLQRRMVTRGIGVPGRVAAGAGVIGIVADTSGSIHDEVLQLFGGHMAAIMDDAQPESIRVYWTDAKVHRVDVIKSSTDLRRLFQKSVPGGGGTDMRVGVDAAIEDGVDSVVVLTDGFTPFSRSCPKPLLWAITTHNITAPSGTTIHI